MDKEKKRIIALDRAFLKLFLSRSNTARKKRANRIKRALEDNEGRWECRLCGKPFNHFDEVSVDHVVPLFHKPKFAKHTVQLAHKSCNADRQHMPVDFFFMFRAIQGRFPNHVIDAQPGERRRREKIQRRLARQCNVSASRVTVLP